MQSTLSSLNRYAASVSKEMKKQPDAKKISSNHVKNTSMKLSYKMQEVKDEQMGILLHYKNLTLEIA